MYKIIKNIHRKASKIGFLISAKKIWNSNPIKIEAIYNQENFEPKPIKKGIKNNAKINDKLDIQPNNFGSIMILKNEILMTIATINSPLYKFLLFTILFIYQSKTSRHIDNVIIFLK